MPRVPNSRLKARSWSRPCKIEQGEFLADFERFVVERVVVAEVELGDLPQGLLHPGGAFEQFDEQLLGAAHGGEGVETFDQVGEGSKEFAGAQV